MRDTIHRLMDHLLPERARWFVAYKLGRLRSMCWSRLVSWALYGTEDQDGLPGRGTATCRADRDRIGSCYCGKFRDEGAA